VIPSSRPTVYLPAAVVALFAALPAAAQRTADDDTVRWLEDCRRGWRDVSWGRDRDWENACEVRDTTIAAGRGRIVVSGGENGGVIVRGWDRNEIRVVARVQAQARREADARDLLREIRIETANTIRADGPRAGRSEGWSVSFEVYVPRRSDLELETHNGGIRVADVEGSIRFDAVNGGVRLANLAGSVRGDTQNGSVSVSLAGERWRGEGLDVRTQNGSVGVDVPARYNAELETGTVNGRFDLDFPVTVSGRLGRTISTRLGDGGPRVRVTTTNGSVRLRRG
jgi:DUF4097 and DUF4098 domain-containing protein YvlB